jgi:hypothetical protein
VSGGGRRGGGHGQGEARGTVSAAGVFGFRKVDAARGFGEIVPVSRVTVLDGIDSSPIFA